MLIEKGTCMEMFGRTIPNTHVQLEVTGLRENNRIWGIHFFKVHPSCGLIEDKKLIKY